MRIDWLDVEEDRKTKSERRLIVKRISDLGHKPVTSFDSIQQPL